MGREIDILKEDSKTGGITVLPTLSGLENLKHDDAMDKKRIIIIFKNNDYENIMCQVLVILVINNGVVAITLILILWMKI